MKKTNDYCLEEETSLNVGLMFIFYWFSLILWQNLNPGATGSLADTVLKLILLCILVYFFFNNSSFRLSKKIILWFFFSSNTIITFLTDGSISARQIVNYGFPIVFSFSCLFLGSEFRITRKELIQILQLVIAIVLYISLYALIFDFSKFKNALSISQAYSNELSSFLVSNHEYGLYLMAGIISCFICLHFDTSADRTAIKIMYYCFIGFFSVCLVLTYSRTAMLATALFTLIYEVSTRNKRQLARFGLLIFVAILFILLNPVLNNFFFHIILKNNTMAGRDDLASLALNTYSEGSLICKLWGKGIVSTSLLFAETLSHNSVHNAYLQVLVQFGFFGAASLILFLLYQIKEALKFRKVDVFWSSIRIGMIIACASTMFTNTTVIFTSPIDSFFLTAFCIMIPKYVSISIKDETFTS